MNRYVKKITILLIICCVGICGCGIYVFYSDINSRKSNVVSDSAPGKESEKYEKKLLYSSDTNSYYEYMDDEYISGIMQIRRDGTHKKKILNVPDEEYDCWMHYVDENWLYYEIVENDECVLYRIPMEKDSYGYDEVKVSETEELFRDSCIRAACWSSNNVVYDNGSGKIVKYDLQKKKKAGEWDYSEFGEEKEKEFDFSRLNDLIIAFVQPMGIYVLEEDAVSWRKCSESGIGYAHNVAQAGNSVFCAEDTLTQDDTEKEIHVWKCDGKSTQSFITGNQMKRAIKDAKGIKEDRMIESCELMGIYEHDGRLYVQIELFWDKGGVCRIEYLIFSQGENETGLRYEKELVETMQSLVKNRTGRWEVRNPDTDMLEKVCREDVIVNDAKCISVVGGGAYLSLYDYERDEGRLGYYGLDTGKFYWITKKEAKRDGLEFQTEDMEYSLMCVFDRQREGNPFIGIEGFPVQDKKKEGAFYGSKDR